MLKGAARYLTELISRANLKCSSKIINNKCLFAFTFATQFLKDSAYSGMLKYYGNYYFLENKFMSDGCLAFQQNTYWIIITKEKNSQFEIEHC